MEHTAAGAIKEWRKHNKVIGQVKISYKNFYENAESSPAGGKIQRISRTLCEISVRAVDRGDQGLVPLRINRLKRIPINGCQNDANWILPMVH